MLPLKHINLAGFKTFVDPTTIPLLAQRVAIVGPNGCGKSNIIDAVRCVLGKSSAKDLRGEAIIDMIFNGSSTRKPVGQASIELVFDNSNNQLGGEYASYSEISIRRQISRDGQSQYYLNHTRCRRSDVVDIFLGTGLGGRHSYAIIEQDTTLLAEAKPEVLRAAIEETAGISRYKERRHETTLRIEHTRDNLARLADLRQEIEKQLAHLQKQANAANRYARLKEDERQLRTQLFHLRAHTFNQQLQYYLEQVTKIETEFSNAHTQNTTLETSIKNLHHTIQEIQTKLGTEQAELHRIEIDLTKLIQTQQHQADRRTKLLQDQEQAIATLKEAEQQTLTDEALMFQMIQRLEETQIDQQQANQEYEAVHKEELALKEALQTWQETWDRFQTQSSETQREVEVEQMRISQLEARLATLLQQIQRLEQESALLHEQTKTDQSNFSDQLEIFQDKINLLEEQLKQIDTSIATRRSQQQFTENETKKLQQELQHLRESFVSLNTLQQAALGQGQENSTEIEWLKTHGLFEKPRLAQLLQVTAGWERAIEVVLNFYLEGICLDAEMDPSQWIHALPEADFTLLSPLKTHTTHNTALPFRRLTEEVNTELPFGYLLSHVYIAENFEEAFSLRHQLNPHESIVTKEGVWIGPHWLRIQRHRGEKIGLIQRERELASLKENISQVHAQLTYHEQSLAENLELLINEETQKNNLQQQLTKLQQQQAEIRGQWQAQQLECERVTKRLQEIQQQLTTCYEEQQHHEQAIEIAQKTHEKALAEMEQQLEMREEYLKQREIHQTALTEKSQQVQILRQKAHEIALKMESLTTQIHATKQHAERLQKQLELQRSQLIAIEEELNQPLATEAFQVDLQQLKQLRHDAEQTLTETKTTLETLRAQENGLMLEKTGSERIVNQLRDQLETERLAQKSVEERFAALEEQMREFGCTLSTEETDISLDESTLENQLEQTQTRITNLGAINLAAIDELKEHETRKHYLDEQTNDLEEALQGLENAIRQIDHETRQRFKETFDAINSHFERLFPRLFGGGQAKLVLNEDDWLTGGVQVFAQPPGKRNSTIHLLSGGEKALTAIALVFSLFELNPAPFCILDEVDAPLDDANVGRFCELVKEMSERVQFVFVTHNKIAMEMAQHLIGVTSHESGVSRLVAVDIEQAIHMVEKQIPLYAATETDTAMA